MKKLTSPQSKEAIEGETTLRESVNLANPKNSFQKKLANGFIKQVGIRCEKSGFSPNSARAIENKIRTGQIRDWSPIIAEVKELPVALDSFAEELSAARVVRLPTPPAEIEQYAKTASKVSLNVTKTEVVGGLLLADGRLVMAAGKVGSGAGLLTFAVDGGIATIRHINGTLTGADYERELCYAAIKGTSVGGGTAVAVVLGATPAGWVVLALGTGAYMVTDFAVRCYEDKRNFSNLTIEDLKAFGIPVSNKPDFGIPSTTTPNLFQ